MTANRLLLALALLLAPWAGRAQTYLITPAAQVPNDGAWHFFNIPVANAGNAQLSASFGLNRACITIQHSEASDLAVRLGSPASGDILLADLDGPRGADFTNACFGMRAPRSVMNGLGPFSGTWIPQEFFSRINRDNLAANGTWYIAIRNSGATGPATFQGASITLQANPAPDPAFVPLCGQQNAGYCRCPDGSDTCDLLPDITTSAMIIRDQNLVDGDSLRFSNATPNIGWGPIEVHGTQQCYCDTVRVPCSTTACPGGAPPKERVIQRVYQKRGNQMTWRDRDMGFMQYHPTHGHVHVEGWSLYTLRVKNQSSDPRQWPIAASSGKRSYCLVNFGTCDDRLGYCVDDTGGTLTHDRMPNYGFGVTTATTCGRDQGIFVGNIDIYATNTPGQAMSLQGICSGDYYIVSETDPDQMVEEVTHANNTAAVPIRLSLPGQGAVPVFDAQAAGPVFTFTASNLPAGTAYVWDFGDGTRDSASNPAVHYYPQAGTYRVSLTYKGQPCGSTVTYLPLVITASSPRLAAASFALRVQPNPATSQSVVQFSLPRAEGARLVVVNAMGQRVRTFAGRALRPGTNALPLGAGLAPGMYTALLETRLGRAGATFVVE